MGSALKAKNRSAKGSLACQKMRADGRVPAVLYGVGRESQEIELDLVEVNTYFRQVRQENVDLDLNGSVFPVRIKEVQRHPVTRDVLHLDFWMIPAKG